MIRARIAAPLAVLACLLAAAGPARAEKKIFGLTSQGAGDTLLCASESSMALGAYLLYETGRPLEETLPIARQSATGKAQPADAERRLRAVNAAKPRTTAQWGRQVFQSCLAQKLVPLPVARTGNCYMLTFYLAAVVPVHKANGHTPKTMMDIIVTKEADPTFRTKLEPLVVEYYGRSDADPRKNNVSDLGRFLKCANPGQPAVSGA